RQERILQGVVEEYISAAQPISSQHLQERYDFGVSPATIRSELLDLSESGYLAQPHTSAGRVPTDKGYRFFVDRLLASGLYERGPLVPRFKPEERDPAALLQRVARELSLASSLVAAVSRGDLLWKEGWESLLSQPEFEDRRTLLNFSRFVEDAERYFASLPAQGSVMVSIGAENRFSKAKDFSILVTVCETPQTQRFTVALLGPRRMAYGKHIHLLASLADSFHGSGS
ncbi:MAG: hypothetical protein Q8P12_06355, partial [bacterium]|nr:hypothetical protein [bacterium]